MKNLVCAGGTPHSGPQAGPDSWAQATLLLQPFDWLGLQVCIVHPAWVNVFFVADKVL